MEHVYWVQADRFLTKYEQKLEVTKWCGPFKKREGWYVLVRALLLAGLLVVSYNTVPPFVLGLIVLIAAYLLGDALLVATSEICGLCEHGYHGLRFVVLNLGVYLSLVLWVAIFARPLQASFDPVLDVENALELGFAAVTASSIISPPQPKTLGAELLVVGATLIALYDLLVIVTVAVGTLSVKKPPRRQEPKAHGAGTPAGGGHD
jgi:hypothetical protein